MAFEYQYLFAGVWKKKKNVVKLFLLFLAFKVLRVFFFFFLRDSMFQVKKQIIGKWYCSVRYKKYYIYHFFLFTSLWTLPYINTDMLYLDNHKCRCMLSSWPYIPFWQILKIICTLKPLRQTSKEVLSKLRGLTNALQSGRQRFVKVKSRIRNHSGNISLPCESAPSGIFTPPLC